MKPVIDIACIYKQEALTGQKTELNTLVTELVWPFLEGYFAAKILEEKPGIVN